MKVLAVAVMFLATQFALANTRTASDMVLILQNEEVKTFLDSNAYNVFNSLEYVGSSRCMGPAMYDLHMSIYTPDGYKKCTKRVVVGECAESGLRNKVKVSDDLNCE